MCSLRFFFYSSQTKAPTLSRWWRITQEYIECADVVRVTQTAIAAAAALGRFSVFVDIVVGSRGHRETGFE